MAKYVNVRVTRFGRPMLSNARADQEGSRLVVTSHQSPRLVKGAVYAVALEGDDLGRPQQVAYTFAGRRGESYYFE